MLTKSNLPAPSCELGYTTEQLKEIFFEEGELERFTNWMVGQTVGVCEARRFNHDTKTYEPACSGVAHGVVTYAYDVKRYVEVNGYEALTTWD